MLNYWIVQAWVVVHEVQQPSRAKADVIAVGMAPNLTVGVEFGLDFVNGA